MRSVGLELESLRDSRQLERTKEHLLRCQGFIFLSKETVTSTRRNHLVNHRQIPYFASVLGMGPTVLRQTERRNESAFCWIPPTKTGAL